MANQRQIRNLDELMDGGLTERFNAELRRVLENVFDPNTDHKKKRTITIGISIVPSITSWTLLPMSEIVNTPTTKDISWSRNM